MAGTSSQRRAVADPEWLDPDSRYELIHGRLIDKQSGNLASETTSFISSALFFHARPENRGRVLLGQTFQCFDNDQEGYRRPNVSFIAAARTASGHYYPNHIPFAPDIAVEVVSPTDRFYDLDDKLNDYRLAGIKLVWVVNPELRTITIHRSDGTITRLFAHETLTGETVLPSFSARVSDLLPPPVVVTPPAADPATPP